MAILVSYPGANSGKQFVLTQISDTSRSTPIYFRNIGLPGGRPPGYLETVSYDWTANRFRHRITVPALLQQAFSWVASSREKACTPRSRSPSQPH
jgi:hypothetical protein